jgi:hypothetical protein
MTELSDHPSETDTAAGRLQITVSDAYHGTVDQRTLDQWELQQARLALSVLKEALRGEAMIRLLDPYIQAADERGQRIAAASNGEWGPPVESLFEVQGLRMEEFFQWFQAHLSDEPAMLAGNPDHYEIRMPEGTITETIGGIPTRFMFHFEPTDPPESFRLDPDFPIRPMGSGGGAMATLLDGVTPVALPAGMQLRETDDGFAMKMSLYFPAAAPEEMLEHHNRHYAIEFSRWITMAYQASRAEGESREQ